MPKFLVCDDAPSFRLLMTRALEPTGATVVTHDHWPHTADRVSAEKPDVVVLDLLMPTFDRGELLRTRAAAPDALLVVLSQLAVEDTQVYLADIEGIDLVMTKRDRPVTIVEELYAALKERGA
jgi:CheY-like chemotaxis protein